MKPVSVCIITFVGPEYLARCLDALMPQVERAGGEVLVPLDGSGDSAAAVAAKYAGVRVLGYPGKHTPAELRARAVAESQGRVVALLEDHCVPAPDWVERMLAAHDGVRAGVGGTVEKGFPPGRDRDGALNWALYLTDYSRYMKPMPAGPAHGLTDTNSSYLRSELERIAPLWQAEFHENVVNGRLRADGRALWLAPDVTVFEQRSVPLADALRDRFTFGRLFGSTRVEGKSALHRIAYAGASVLMPPLMIARVARNLFGRGRYRLPFVRALPALALINTVWILGECVGYLTASPGALAARSVPAPGV